MSDTINDADDVLSVASKLRRYSYLMPMASPHMQRKVASGTPLGEAGVVVVSEPLAEEPTVAEPDWSEPSAEIARDRARGCLLGLAVGNAIGASVNSKARDSFSPLTDMAGGGASALAAGEWSEDTTMALCLADSLIESSTVDQYDFMTRMVGWLEHGENTVSGRCVAMGDTTRAAIKSFMTSDQPSAGRTDANSVDNGSLVRLAPLAIAFKGDRDTAEAMALKQSRTTHATRECLDACKLLTSMLIDALTGADATAALRPRVMDLSPNILFINAGEWREKSRTEIQSSSYVVHTLEAAVWAVGTTGDFRSAVLAAANLGGDADSVAAVAGQLAGAVYGASAIPAEWLAKLAWREKIQGKADQLFDLGKMDN